MRAVKDEVAAVERTGALDKTLDEGERLAAAARITAFAYFREPEEDIYSPGDDEPFELACR